MPAMQLALADEVYNGHATSHRSFLPPGNDANRAGVDDFSYVPADRAKPAGRAGYEPGELSFDLVIDVADENLAQWLQSHYDKIGVTLSTVSLDPG
ncbi:hypothetical protein IU433_14890 [Nocardia puris]|uniref:Uncharacterized protein n=1 Tax=Nocardia puris TaxID=208602 RepID=A0A366DDJ5_9NOCA|nr:hypothetical protein [Nocardia puris]MBF6214624.1 hypothetical protein [Nocardia puris]MBF6366033.1 hypothetical protein [Nocardia puris]MBF6460324.1 hypothetical protein [Nocardia puris]RBO87318.1 hypothetical protein DFR74_11123 [Nocardia puris]